MHKKTRSVRGLFIFSPVPLDTNGILAHFKRWQIEMIEFLGFQGCFSNRLHYTPRVSAVTMASAKKSPKQDFQFKKVSLSYRLFVT